jgi:hypothetical protein
VDSSQGVIAVVPSTLCVHVSILVGVTGLAYAEPGKTGVVHGAGEPVITGARVGRVGAPSLYARFLHARISVAAVLGRFAAEAANVVFVHQTVAVVVQPVVTDLFVVGRLDDAGMNRFVLIVAVRPPADVAHIPVQVFIDRTALIVTESLVTIVHGAGIFIVALGHIGARNLQGRCQSSLPCRILHPSLLPLVVVPAAHQKKKA